MPRRPRGKSSKPTKPAAGRGAARPAGQRRASARAAARRPRAPAQPTLLAGGNPRIEKADGDAPVQAYLAAVPGWKRDVARRLDTLVTRTVPGVQKAVRWNTPFYGVSGRGWFLAFHCITRYLKVAFLNGAALRPPPPVPSKNRGTRYLHLHEGEAIDEALVVHWIQQAASLPGERCF